MGDTRCDIGRSSSPHPFDDDQSLLHSYPPLRVVKQDEAQCGDESLLQKAARRIKERAPGTRFSWDDIVGKPISPACSEKLSIDRRRQHDRLPLSLSSSGFTPASRTLFPLTPLSSASTPTLSPRARNTMSSSRHTTSEHKTVSVNPGTNNMTLSTNAVQTSPQCETAHPTARTAEGMLAPRVTVIPEVGAISLECTILWAAVIISTEYVPLQLKNTLDDLVTDGDGPGDSDACTLIRNLEVDILPAEQCRVLQIINDGNSSRTLFGDASRLFLVQVEILPLSRPCSAMQTSDDLLHQMECELGSAQCEFLHVHMTHDHPALSELNDYGKSTDAASCRVETKLHCHAVACISRYDPASIWSPVLDRPCNDDDLTSIIASHWGWDAAEDFKRGRHIDEISRDVSHLLDKATSSEPRRLDSKPNSPSTASPSVEPRLSPSPAKLQHFSSTRSPDCENIPLSSGKSLLSKIRHPSDTLRRKISLGRVPHRSATSLATDSQAGATLPRSRRHRRMEQCSPGAVLPSVEAGENDTQLTTRSLSGGFCDGAESQQDVDAGRRELSGLYESSQRWSWSAWWR